jgi:HSF-type DNA-binding
MAKPNEDSMLFPQKLMEILADPDNQKAISWLPSGKAFVIHDRDTFAESVMPKYFSRQAKYSSFTRKLNRWYVPCNTHGALADFIWLVTIY